MPSSRSLARAVALCGAYYALIAALASLLALCQTARADYTPDPVPARTAADVAPRSAPWIAPSIRRAARGSSGNRLRSR